MSPRARRLSFSEMQQVVREAYAFHYVCMNLGFTSDDLFVGTAFIGNWDPPGLCATVELHAQGRKFIYTLCALVPEDDARFVRFWTEFAREQPKRGRGELDRIVHDSHVWKDKGAILGALAGKGFVFPSVGAEKSSASEGLTAPGSWLLAPGSGGSGSVN